MSPATRLLALALAVLLAASIPDAAAQARMEQPAPAFSLPDLEGKPTGLDAQRGKIVVVHFAATWCPFCAAEAPHLEKLHRDYRDRGVVVWIVNLKEPAAVVARNARKFGLTFPVLLDADGGVAERFAPPASVQPDLARDEVMIASNLLIDRQGRIRFLSLLDSARFDAKLVALRERLDALLEER